MKMLNIKKFVKANNLKIKYCTNLLTKAFGFMFSKPDKILIFKFDKEKRQSIHMLFVFFPIDVIFLNKNKEIIEIKTKLKPFSFYTSKNKAKYIIEIPSCFSNNFKIDIGEKIIFNNNI